MPRGYSNKDGSPLGGPGRNQGARPNTDGPYIRTSISLAPADLATLRAIDPNVSRAIRMLIRKAMEDERS